MGRASWRTYGTIGARATRAVALAIAASGCIRTRTEFVAPLAPAPRVVPPLATEPAAARREAEGPSSVEMKRVDFHIAPEVVLRIRQLRGTAVATRAGEPVVFDDKESFTIDVASGDAGIAFADVGRLLNQYVFAYDGAPLSDVHVSADGTRVRLRATLHKGADVRVDIVGILSPTADGDIRVHPVRISAAGVRAGTLLQMTGLTLSRLVDFSRARGARLVGNDIILDPDRMLPPPTIHGLVTAARVEGGEIRLTFGNRPLPPREAPPDTTGNYLYFRNGTVRFGKLFMVHADMEMVDEAPGDPFDFSLDEYVRQLVAGYVKNTTARGLVVHVPDLRTLGAARQAEP